MTLVPAPKGAGLVVENKCKNILRLAGVKDVYSKTRGKTSTKLNLFKACFDALKQLSRVKIQPEFSERSGVVEGAMK